MPSTRRNHFLNGHAALFLAALAVAPLAGQEAAAQAFSFTQGGLSYSENFDTLGVSGTAFLPGWAGYRVSSSSTQTGPVAALLVGTGSSNTGGIYNVGVAGVNPVSDRAMGTLTSGSWI